MEPMDLDSDNECSMNKSLWQSYTPTKSHSPMYGGESPTNISDMDVDSGSPSPSKNKVQASTSLEHLRNAIESLLSMKSPTHTATDSKPVKDCDIDSPSSVPAGTTSSENLSIIKDKPSSTWEPAATVARGAVAFRRHKKGYGIPQEEKTFAHFPKQNYRSRHDNQSRHRNTRNPFSGTRELLSQTEQSSFPRLKDSSGKDSSGKDSSQSCWVGCCKVLLVILFMLLCSLAVLFVIDLRKRWCSQSRDFNQAVLKMNLEADLYGQHIVSSLLPEEIDNYFRMLHIYDTAESDDELTDSNLDSPIICKPLILSFHGWTGVGKNFVSKIISNSFPYSKISLYNIPLHFPHKALESNYGQQIQKWIVGNFTACRTNVVIMDEMDKAYPEVVSGIASAIQALSQPCSIASPAIFLLLSNSKAVDINRVFLEFLQESSSNTREQLTPEHFVPVFQDGSDMWYSKLVEDDLLRTFVPFLPLEKNHVVQCIKRDFISKSISTDEDMVNRILRELTFTKIDNLELSTTGCKRVSDKVDYILVSEKHS